MQFYGLLQSTFSSFWNSLTGKNQGVAPSLTTPNYASTSVLLAQEKERRKSLVQKGRRSTDVTGGSLSGKPTLGMAGSLFGL